MADSEREMNPKSTLNGLLQSWSQFWNERNARERMLLAAAATAVAAGLVYLLLIDPALTGREQLKKSLPALRQQVAQLQMMAKQAAGMSGRVAPSVAPISRETLEAALVRKGLKPQNVTLTGETARVQLSSVSFSGVIDWIDEMQKTALLSVVDANIVALDQPDMVNVTLTLRQQKSE
jgi:general secretion pathway protein M